MRPQNSELTPVIPYNEESEAALLGCVLLESDRMDTAVAELRPGKHVFYDHRHQLIWDSAQSLHAENVTISMLSVIQHLKRNNLIEEAGGVSYVASLPDKAPTAGMIAEFIRSVLEHYRLRKIMAVCSQIIYDIKEGHKSSDVIDRLDKEILSIQQLKPNEDSIPIGIAVREAVDQIDTLIASGGILPGVSTGYQGLDELTAGFIPGTMSILAARPGIGKTSMAMNIAVNASKVLKKPVMFVSLEMGATELAMRLLHQVTGVDSYRMRRGLLLPDEVKEVANTVVGLQDTPLHIVEQTQLTVFHLRGLIRSMIRRHNVEMVIVDYLQLMTTGIHRGSDRVNEVSVISRTLKEIAMETRLPIVVLSQLNRSLEKDDDRAPRLSDLRESGAIEQDADLVMLLWRPNVAGTHRTASVRHEVRMDIAKQRNGPTGRLHFTFEPSTTTFYEGAPAVPQSDLLK